MKKFIATTLVTIMMSAGTAFAANQNNTGCGLGTMVFEGSNFSNTTVGQVLIVTTNGTSGNQTFGITSGTSNCEQPTNIVKNERLQEFVVANMDSIAKDIATAEGESLDTLSELMEISPEQRPLLYAKLQSNFSSIYTSNGVTAAEVIDNIYMIIN